MKMEIAESVYQNQQAVVEGTPAKVEVKNLAVYYGKFRALTDINLTVHENKITAIIGPSGCGKSTLLRSFNRMNDLTPGCRMEGEVILDGENVLLPSVDVVMCAGGWGWSSSAPTHSPSPFTTMWPTGRGCMASAVRRTWMESWKTA